MHDFMKAAIEQHLAELTDEEWVALTARVRPPKQPNDNRKTASPDATTREK